MSKILKFWSIYRSYVILIVVCILLLMVKPHVISLLDRIVEWLSVCSKGWFALLITGASFAVSFIILLTIKAKEKKVAHSTLAVVLFVTLFYSYFRFIDQSYEFWGLGWYKWTDILYIPFIMFVVQMVVCNRHKIESPNNYCLHISDKPIDDPREDQFGYDWMSQSLLDDLATVDVRKKSFSLGILGVWGQGKSSFMNLFKLHAEEQGSIVVEFYPRASKSIKSIQEDFFSAFKAALKHYHTGIERYISNYAREVAEIDEGWIGKLALAFTHLSSDKEMARINDVIQSIGRRIYVMIEDLDRLTGEEILEVLKLMERNGDFCNTVFVTAYDKKYVNEVIRNYLKTSYQDYTDKYFDFEYSLPLNHQGVLTTFAGKYISDKIELQKNDRTSAEQLKDVWNVNGGFIVAQLGTMRHVKRFLNIFMSRYPKVKNDVDVADFLVLTLLRYKDLTAYNSLFELRFIRRGSTFVSGTTKLFYLQDDYEERLKKLQIPDSSKVIIERLFSKKDALENATIDSVWGKLKWAESFNSYFYDYRIGRYHFEDFQQLFTVDESEAFATVQQMQKGGITAQLTDFLKSRKESWIVDKGGLSRFIKIAVYLDSLERTMDLDFMISGMLIKSTMDEYVKVGVVQNVEEYKNTVREALESMMEKCPMEVGFACLRINDEYLQDKATEEKLAFTPEELVGISVWAQRFYYKKYEGGDYLINAIFNLAKVNERKDGTIRVTEPAKRELAALIELHPEQFAKDVVVPSPYVAPNGKKYLNLRFNEHFEYEKLLDLDDFSFENWIESLSDRKMSYVMKRIFEKGRYDVLQVPAIKADYEMGDFDGFYEAVKTFDEDENDKVVLGIIERDLPLDYRKLCELSGLDIVRAKESVGRLLSKNLIEGKYSSMKDEMEPFEKGDYVKFVDSVYEAYTKAVYYSDNVFKIVKVLNDGSLKLADIEVAVPRENIEAIPIDGIHDSNIYYDPIIAASYVEPGQPVPVHHSQSGRYYLDGLANTRLENKKTLKQIVEEHDCWFVHEVQHCLREIVNKDDLKLNETIKTNM